MISLLHYVSSKATLFDSSILGEAADVAQLIHVMGEAMKIHISQATRVILGRMGGYRTEYRGILDMGEKLGSMETYWLLGFDRDSMPKDFQRIESMAEN